MRVLIVEEKPDLGRLWARHLTRLGYQVELAHNQSEAVQILRNVVVEIIVLDLVLSDGSAFAIADYSSYRLPTAKIVFVNNSSFFSDGSIFQHVPNACAMMPSEVSPEDLGAVVEHYASH